MIRPRTALLLVGIALIALLTAAQAPTGPVASFTAVVGDAKGAQDTVRIDVLRWSTDAERDQMFAAWTQPGSAAAKGSEGRARPAIDENDPAFAGLNPAAAKGKGGRGGAEKAEAPKPTPERSLAAALARAEAIGRVWSSAEVAGYSVRYAVRLAQPDGERILLITDRRLGAWNDTWKAGAAESAPNYDFTLVELRVNAKGEGEGKASLGGRVAADAATKVISLETYGSVPMIFKNVRRRAK